MASLLGQITFAPGKKDLGEAAQLVLSDALKVLQAEPAVTVLISGFADPSGNTEKNLELAIAPRPGRA